MESNCTSTREEKPVLTSGMRAAIIVAILLGLVLRLWGLSQPPFDRHSFRQSQTLSTIEAFHADGIDLFHPKAIYMGYPGTFILELPVFQAAAATLFNWFGPHIEIVRLINILLGAAATWVLYRITEHYLGKRTAIFAALIYWLAPLNILYQRSTLIDPLAVLCALLAFLSLTWLSEQQDGSEKRRIPWGIFGLFLATTWLTAMVKALYLWPAVLLLGKTIIDKKFRPNRRLIAILAVFCVSGVCFLAWNCYAGKINATSPFTRGVKPTSHLGMSMILLPDFYVNQIIRRPKWWLSVIGALLYPVGLFGAWKNRSKHKGSVWILHLTAPTYLLAFANINQPHEYYQLLITPFLAITSGYGLHFLLSRISVPASIATAPKKAVTLLAVIFGLGISFATYAFWFHGPRLDPSTMQFQELCKGKFPGRPPGMVFVSQQKYNIPPVGSYIPEFLYAANLWGYGITVENADEARPVFDELAPAFTKLEYVVFYGTEIPSWLPSGFKLVSADENHQLYTFKAISKDGSAAAP